MEADAPTEDDRRRAAPRTWAPLAPHLFLVLECDRPLSGGAHFDLSRVGEVIIGRGTERSARREPMGDLERLEIRVPARAMSATHARICRRDDRFELVDAGSRNGVLLDGIPVKNAELQGDAWFELGRTLFRFRGALPTPDVAGGAAHASLVPTLLPLVAKELAVVRNIAASSIAMLLLGETGTGKEVLARAIHEASGRKGRFVAVNCGALPAALIESQLFGHEKGAFSGAVRSEPGLVRAAEGGTLFLDEVADLPIAAQPALLRVLQEGEILPVGAVKSVAVDVRVVAATHKPLEAMVERGEFRADLFARIAAFSHRLPPLRDRREDLGVLTATLLPRVAGARADALVIAPAAAAALARHAWPLNVRELQHVLACGASLAVDGTLDVEHLPASVTAPSVSSAPDERRIRAEDEALRATLLAHLDEHRGNVTHVARAMGKAPMQVYRWMRRLGIDPTRHRA